MGSPRVPSTALKGFLAIAIRKSSQPHFILGGYEDKPAVRVRVCSWALRCSEESVVETGPATSKPPGHHQGSRESPDKVPPLCHLFFFLSLLLLLNRGTNPAS